MGLWEFEWDVSPYPWHLNTCSPGSSHLGRFRYDRSGGSRSLGWALRAQDLTLLRVCSLSVMLVVKDVNSQLPAPVIKPLALSLRILAIWNINPKINSFLYKLPWRGSLKKKWPPKGMALLGSVTLLQEVWPCWRKCGTVCVCGGGMRSQIFPRHIQCHRPLPVPANQECRTLGSFSNTMPAWSLLCYTLMRVD